jgi:hypothetical protein
MGMMFFPNEKTEKYIRECLGLPNLSEKEKKELEAAKEEKEREQEKLEREKLNTKPLPPRKTAEHETDDKKPFNEIYEQEGMKKLWNKFKEMFKKNE